MAVEAMASVLVMLMSIPIFYSLWAFTKSGEEQAVAAGQLKTVAEGFESYVLDNHTNLIATATATTATGITFATMKAAGHVRAGVSDTNIWGQGYVAYVLEPKAGTLEIIILTTGGSRTDVDFRNQVVPGTAVKIGSKGGYVPSGLLTGQATATMQGSYNGWQKSFTGTNIPNPGAGHLVHYSNTDDVAAGQDFLYRKAVPGNPQLNTMETDLNMGSKNIDGAGNITASGTVSAAKVKVPTGNNLQVGGVYYYGDTVSSAVRQSGSFHVQHLDGSAADIAHVRNIASTGSISAAGNISAVGTVSAAKVTVPGGNNLQVGNSYYYGDGANSAIRQNGSLYLQHMDGSAADIASVGNITSTGSVSAAGNITAAGSVNAYGSFVSYNGIIYGVSNNWGMQLLNAGWGGNGAPQSAVGSANVNDIYIRSIGKWASQLGSGGINYGICTSISWGGGGGTCPANYVFVGGTKNTSDSHEWTAFTCCQLI